MMFDFEYFLNNCDALVENAMETSRELSDLSNYSDLEENIVESLNYDHGENVEIYFYGSRLYELASHSSDLDIFVDDNESSNFYGNGYFDTDDLLYKIYDTIYGSYEWKVNAYMPNSKVPLVRATYLPMDLKCDIMVDNGLGVRSSELVEHLFYIQTKSRRFFHFIRMWLEGNGIRMKTYTLAMLVIFYLQQHNFMPSTYRVQKNLEEEYIDDVEVQFFSDYTICSYGVRKLRFFKDFLSDFFEFYHNFDFESRFISVVDGRSYDYHSSVSHIPEMPEMKIMLMPPNL